MPHDFPPWQTVYVYYWQWRNSGLWDKINAALVAQVRVKQGREAQPSAGIIDSQSVKTSEGGEARDVDVYKQVCGRKRYIVVDTLGLLLIVLVHSASIPDGNGGKLVLARLFERIKHSVYNRWCRLKLIWQMANTNTSSLGPRNNAVGDWRSFTGHPRPKIFNFCHAVGLSNALSDGLAANDAWVEITNTRRFLVSQWCISPVSIACCDC
jgi:hypothetical protein